MMKFSNLKVLGLLAFGFALWTGCQSKPAEKAIEAPTAAAVVFPDSVFVHVDSTGTMTLGGKKVETTEALKVVITDSLLQLKKQSGKLPALGYRTHGDVLMGMRGELRSIFAEILEAIQ